MEYIEDYDDQCHTLVKKIDKLFKACKEASDADKAGLLLSIKRGIKEFREVCVLYKSDLYLVPRAKEAECRKKYDAYIDRLGKYDHNCKKLELIIKKDEEGLLELKHQYEEDKYKKLGGQTALLAKQGFETQAKSKDALQRIKATVHKTQELGD